MTPTPTATSGPGPVAPAIAVTGGPEGLVNSNAPTFTFQSSDPLATFSCRFDSAPFAPCSGPGATHRSPTPLGEGSHTFSVVATSLGGVTSPAAVREFTVDTIGPQVKVKKKPKKRTRSRKAKFVFQTEAGATAFCKLDRSASKPCSSPKKYRKLKRRKHTFVVRATDPAGNVGKAVKVRWKIKRK